jgi:type I site-specific restriction endonuclease
MVVAARRTTRKRVLVTVPRFWETTGRHVTGTSSSRQQQSASAAPTPQSPTRRAAASEPVETPCGSRGSADDIARAKNESHGLGIFIRSLVGLDREAAKQAFGQFLTGSIVSANQVEFVNMIVDYLTEHGVMEAARLYESPFTDVSPHGPEGVFSAAQVDQLVAVLTDIRARAAA